MSLFSTKKSNEIDDKRVVFKETVKTETEIRKTHIGKTVKIKGSVVARENMTVEGRINGDIDINKIIIIEKGGIVNADIKANAVRIKGRFKGKIEAFDRIEILNNGICEGDITTDKLVVKEGAILLGKININNNFLERNTDKGEQEVIEGELIEIDDKEKTDTEIIENDIDEEKIPEIEEVNDNGAETDLKEKDENIDEVRDTENNNEKEKLENLPKKNKVKKKEGKKRKKNKKK